MEISPYISRKVFYCSDKEHENLKQAARLCLATESQWDIGFSNVSPDRQGTSYKVWLGCLSVPKHAYFPPMSIY